MGVYIPPSQIMTTLLITQTQIVQALNNEFKDRLITETTLNRFERLDITPRTCNKIRPVLEKLLTDSQLKFGDRFKLFSIFNLFKISINYFYFKLN